MSRFGLIGYPLTHSYSADWFRGKLDYRLYEIASLDELPELDGYNVTIPYKEKIIPYLDALSPEAAAVGAVNCVVNKVGYNTDIEGFRKALLAFNKNAKSALILGNGGASKAVQYVLRERGIPYTVCSRSGVQPSRELVARNPLIINATPVGMYPHTDASPLPHPDAITSEHYLMDLIYNPAETLFLKQGRERGARTENGMTMFIAQAEASWKLFTNFAQ